MSNVHEMNDERSFSTVSNMTRTPLSDTRCDNESIHAEGMAGLGPSHHECNSSDVSGVARENPPSEGGCNGTSLNVNFDIVGEKPKHSGLGLHNVREVVRLSPWLKCVSYVTLHQMSFKT